MQKRVRILAMHSTIWFYSCPRSLYLVSLLSVLGVARCLLRYRFLNLSRASLRSMFQLEITLTSDVLVGDLIGRGYLLFLAVLYIYRRITFCTDGTHRSTQRSALGIQYLVIRFTLIAQERQIHLGPCKPCRWLLTYTPASDRDLALVFLVT